MTTPTDQPGRELRPVDRHEWISIILRARLGGLITGSGRTGEKGRATRGGVSATAFKAVALAWASHADPDGTNIWPGDATIAVEAEVGLQVAQAVKRKMIELGLTERVRARSRRHRRGDEHRLTLPSDLLDAVDVLSPAALQMAAINVYERRRGKRGGSGGDPTPPGMGSPVDTPQDPTDPTVGDPVDPPHEPDAETCGGSGGHTTDVCGGSGGTHVGGPVARVTYPETNPVSSSPSQTDNGVRTAVTVPRVGEAVDEPDPAIEEKTQPPPAPARPAGCPDHGPAMKAGNRPDGQPRCPLCRRGAPPSTPPAGHLATVTQLHQRAS
ncbi:hypothetical protein ACH4T9_19920 [Micromonospora sp. NPDC020750]|uniref:hypothetical protein n=1 Tax=unclassified Micromonospora TaxID=2617518 RepID=UPI00379D1BA5